eukprot:GILI01003768.1.p1 GENE.GILI01003768.1~~GILI01003768.1.p1  ORF type:complete len:860 (+),score=232.74 GILI01003768.1:133-2712(+)
MSTVLNITIADTSAKLSEAISGVFASAAQPSTKKQEVTTAPFVSLVAESSENPSKAVSRFNPITHVTLLTNDGSHLISCDLRAIMHSAEQSPESDAPQQPRGHPLGPLLHLLGTQEVIKVLADGRGIQDAIASDLRMFDTALLNHVVDLAVLPIYFGYTERYQPRFQRGVIRLPSLVETSAFLRLSYITAPKLFNFKSGATQVDTKSLEPVIAKLWSMKAIACSQLTPATLSATATTPGTSVLLLQKEERAVHAAEVAASRKAKLGASEGNGKDKKNGRNKTVAAGSKNVNKYEQQLAVEAAATEAYNANITLTEEDNQKLAQAAVADILATSRRFIDTLGSFQHPQLLKKRQDPTADDSEAKLHLDKLLDPRGGYYLPFGVFQPLTSHADRRAANQAAANRSHHQGSSSAKQHHEDAAQLLLSKQTKLFEEDSFKHQQAIEAQRRDAATSAAKGNPVLESAVKSVLGGAPQNGSPSSGNAPVPSESAAQQQEGPKDLVDPAASAATNAKKKRKEKAARKEIELSRLSSYFRTHKDEDAPKTSNPNRPVDAVALCSVCFLPFTAKVSPHQNQQQQDPAQQASNTICANCIERALPCEFHRRGCCQRKEGECDYVHAHVPCPYGAQCIRFAIERFAAASAKQEERTESATSSIVNGISAPQTPNSFAKKAIVANAPKNSGCCPFTHPGEPGYVAHTYSAKATPVKAATPSPAIPSSFSVSGSTAAAPSSSPFADIPAGTPFGQMAPSLINPVTGEVGLMTTRRGRARKNVAAPAATTTGEAATGTTVNNNSVTTSASEAAPPVPLTASAPAAANAADGRKKAQGLCHMHFYSPGGCPHGRRCQLSHEPIPLFVPIPVVRQ